MFEEGCKFIRFSPYGGITKGIVKQLSKHTVVDETNKILYIKYQITSTLDQTYDIEECREILSEDEHEFEKLKKEFYKNSIKIIRNFGKIQVIKEDVLI